jgi:hypothetical protein
MWTMWTQQQNRVGWRWLATVAVIAGWQAVGFADDESTATPQASSVKRSRDVQPLSAQAGEACGVAKVPCTANNAAAGGQCLPGACGPNGCAPGGWGAPYGGVGYGAGGASTNPNAWNRTRTFLGQNTTSWGDVETDWGDELVGSSGACPVHGHSWRDACRQYSVNQWNMFAERWRYQNARLYAHCKGKQAYFHPMGNGGEGVPPFGCYCMVYAVDPNYSDPRDRQIHGAQGYGIPIAVPLAPTVRHTMNYSTGIPSSRLTPISNVVPPRRGYGW